MVWPLGVYAQDDVFEHIVLGNASTQYDVVKSNTRFFEIKAEGRNSASGLYGENIKRVAPDYPEFKWSWRVDQPQRSADISIKDKEDFAASIQIAFGSMGFLKKPKVLTYAWIATDHDIGIVIKSPRIPDHFRTIVVGNIQTALKEWHTHTRNILEDYRIAYGEYPDRDISAIGVFTDNDQTREDVIAHYRLYVNSD